MALARPPQEVYSGNWHGGSSYSSALPVDYPSNLIGLAADYEVYPGQGGTHVSGPSWGGPLPMFPSGLAGLADFPRVGRMDRELLRGRQAEGALMGLGQDAANKPAPEPTQPLRIVVAAAATPNAAAKAPVLSRLSSQRRKLLGLSAARAGVARSAGAKFQARLREVKALDRKVAMASPAAAPAIAAVRDAKALAATRWSKLQAVAAVMAGNARAQAAIVGIVAGAVKRNQPDEAEAAGRAFQTVGQVTDQLRQVRAEQVRKWSSHAPSAKIERLEGRRARAALAMQAGVPGGTQAVKLIDEALERARAQAMRRGGNSTPAIVSIDWEANFEEPGVGTWLAGLDLEGFGSPNLGAAAPGTITTACRNHITVFTIAWQACTVFPASLLKGPCREVAKLALRTAARSIGGACPAAAEAVISPSSTPATPPPAPIPEPAPAPPASSNIVKYAVPVGIGAAALVALWWLL